ncbi:arf GAP with coiled coil, ANK repeat and PH [Trichuris trichiura]|uniref:Arf GAP with coiled coil, ANK repeat and PH n=1 Tax=Trichuris trichiura TaxID=36087 RepID=A0A077ZPR3_TRITR|nr:arf GAP with coiled coil, ANK repeat and PH [Trichuris trichiura]
MNRINWVHTSKKHEILEAFLSFIYATETFFHQGHDLFQSDWLNVKNELVSRLQSLKEDTRQLEKKMQDRHALVPKEVFLHPCGLSVDPDVVMEGYLFKRSSRAIRTWNRRWFIIKNNKLLYVRPEVDFNNQLFPVDISTGCTVMEDDLRLCLVRPAQSSCDRRYCFEVVTPSKYPSSSIVLSHMLQADSESLRLAWIKALKRTIEAALHDSMPDMPSNGSTGNLVKAMPKDHTTSGTAVRNEGEYNATALSIVVIAVSDQISVCNLPGNELCAECGSKDPKWASLNMGITLCIECSGIHRCELKRPALERGYFKIATNFSSLGVQVSKVRSITLDVWEPEQVQLMRLLGNRIVNNIYTASNYERRLLKPNSPRFAREAVIKAKYLKRSFMRPFSRHGRLFRRHLINCACSNDGKDQIDVLRLLSDEMMCQSNELIVATARNDIPAMFTAIASGASVNCHSADGSQGTALHQSKSAIACELLLLNGADINAQDGLRKTLLHYACEAGNTALVCFLVKRGADQGLVDIDGKCPLDIAIDQANADIVTLLRLAKLSDEFKGDSVSLNELAFLDVCRDFTLTGSRSPSLC